ncbi:MAG TPA: hypothetical protein VLJ59_20440 [Mycobacteriales bacterium]|nr:hypothetical protein [Mycobacteriales bacterium]
MVWWVFVVAAVAGGLAASGVGVWAYGVGSPAASSPRGVRPGRHARARHGGRHRPGRAAVSSPVTSVAGPREREGADTLWMFPGRAGPVPARPG